MRSVVAGLILGATALFATDTVEVVSEPAFADVFYRLDPAYGLIPLERQRVIIQVDSHGSMPYFPVIRSVNLFPGPKATVRFSASPSFDFVVRSPLPATTDPSTVYVLEMLNRTKKNRELVFGIVNGIALYGATATDIRDQSILPTVISRYGTASLKMHIGSLPPGEYAIGRMHGQFMFCFGVD
jgi:hypothetical protein